jgi:hypothetical protein
MRHPSDDGLLPFTRRWRGRILLGMLALTLAAAGAGYTARVEAERRIPAVYGGCIQPFDPGWDSSRSLRL